MHYEAFQVTRVVGDHVHTIFGYYHSVGVAKARIAGDKEAWFDAHHHARLQNGLIAQVEEGGFVTLKPYPVPNVGSGQPVKIMLLRKRIGSLFYVTATGPGSDSCESCILKLNLKIKVLFVPVCRWTHDKHTLKFTDIAPHLSTGIS
jgi:hypothetical protein